MVRYGHLYGDLIDAIVGSIGAESPTAALETATGNGQPIKVLVQRHTALQRDLPGRRLGRGSAVGKALGRIRASLLGSAVDTARSGTIDLTRASRSPGDAAGKGPQACRDQKAGQTSRSLTTPRAWCGQQRSSRWLNFPRHRTTLRQKRL